MRTTLLTAAVLAAATAGSAATVCVSPAGGACQTKIQDAVDMAAPFDRITVAAGTYYENVDVPAGKDGLQIVGAGRASTIIDPSPQTDLGLAGNTGDALVIRSRNVQVRGFTFRNGLKSGVRVLAASGTIITANNFYGQDQYGVVALGSLANTGTQVLGNEFRGVQSAIAIDGLGSVVKTNVIVDCALGIQMQGDRAQVVGNRLSNSYAGIALDGGSAVVTSNDLRNVYLVGINVFGSAPLVSRNRVFQSGTNVPIGVSCQTDCAGGTVAYNVVTESGLQSVGMYVATDAAGLTVNNNVLLRSGALGGVSLVGDGFSVFLNTVTDPGADAGATCISSYGDYNYFGRNLLKGCASTGIYVSGDGNYLDRNTAVGTLESGFTIDGYVDGVAHHDDNALYGNRVTGAGGQGIAIIKGADGTAVLANVALTNRIDFCDQGTNTSLFGNTIGKAGTCDILH